jgi:hypothetical protein
VYELAAAGLGTIAIAKRLNTEGVPGIGPAGKDGSPPCWTRPYVGKLLGPSYREALGEYRPRTWRDLPADEDGRVRRKRVPDGVVFKGYYPAIINEDLWNAARAATEARRHKGGRPGRAGVQLFAGLLRCPLTGGAIHQVNRIDQSRLDEMMSLPAAAELIGVRPVSAWRWASRGLVRGGLAGAAGRLGGHHRRERHAEIPDLAGGHRPPFTQSKRTCGRNTRGSGRTTSATWPSTASTRMTTTHQRSRRRRSAAAA